MAAPLVFDEEEAEDEEENETSGSICAQCEDELPISSEIFLLRIVHPFVADGTFHQLDLLNDEGAYKYEPAFFCFSCWEDEEEALREIQEDVPPLLDDVGLISCDICQSDVLSREAVGLLHFGEIQWSARSPNGIVTPTFAPMSEGKHICIACLHHLDTNRTNPLWPDDFEPALNTSVCIEGIFSRCWRYGNCTCPRTLKR